MARIRTLKPEFWQDEKLAPLPAIDRLVFLGLISQADDAGRLVDNPRLLDGLLFPHTKDSSVESLETLWRIGRIIRYTSSSGQRLLQIVGWSKHQKVQKPSAYVLPAPSDNEHSRDPLETLQRTNGESQAPIPDPRPTTYDQQNSVSNETGGEPPKKLQSRNGPTGLPALMATLRKARFACDQTDGSIAKTLLTKGVPQLEIEAVAEGLARLRDTGRLTGFDPPVLPGSVLSLRLVYANGSSGAGQLPLWRKAEQAWLETQKQGGPVRVGAVLGRGE